jgi:CubicO group peptidase (beta-lactamase class C family)
MSSSPAAESAPSGRPHEELERTIRKIIADTGTSAVGIALVNRDGPYWVAGIGKADLAAGREADEDTLFRIGSISKMFAALAVRTPFASPTCSSTRRVGMTRTSPSTPTPRRTR